MLRSSARSACILLAAAQIPSALCLLPPGWEELVHATVEMLQFWRNDVEGIDVATDLLQRLLSNIQ
jgi:hypothetical protein